MMAQSGGDRKPRLKHVKLRALSLIFLQPPKMVHILTTGEIHFWIISRSA